MFYQGESSSTDEQVHMAETTKGFEGIGAGDYYDMDGEANYQDLFNAAADQAVPDYLTLNTPPVTTNSSHPLNNINYMNSVDSIAIPSADSYCLSQQPSPYFSSASHTSSPVPQLSTIADQTYINRAPVIVPSATAPQPKPRRKGGRKPKNDPLPPHLEERRRLRRIRNKEAAQKCRERRLAQTDDLLQQIDALERQTLQYEEFINRMREYKEQCEFVLSSHKSHCNQVAKRRLVTGLTLNTFNNNSCATAHRRSSSSEGEITSPTPFIM